MLNNAKPYFFLNEMNRKDLPTMYSTAFGVCLRTTVTPFKAKKPVKDKHTPKRSGIHCR